eukprot:scaffold4719_cov29-Tisochrysis_lutea.AAC.1
MTPFAARPRVVRAWQVRQARGLVRVPQLPLACRVVGPSGEAAASWAGASGPTRRGTAPPCPACRPVRRWCWRRGAAPVCARRGEKACAASAAIPYFRREARNLLLLRVSSLAALPPALRTAWRGGGGVRALREVRQGGAPYAQRGGAAPDSQPAGRKRGERGLREGRGESSAALLSLSCGLFLE